eukprot:1937587-Ditylum_brightwellii.AAC.1
MSKYMWDRIRRINSDVGTGNYVLQGLAQQVASQSTAQQWIASSKCWVTGIIVTSITVTIKLYTDANTTSS